MKLLTIQPELHIFVPQILTLGIAQYHILQVAEIHSANQQKTHLELLHHFGSNLQSAFERFKFIGNITITQLNLNEVKYPELVGLSIKRISHELTNKGKKKSFKPNRKLVKNIIDKRKFTGTRLEINREVK